ncbi:MAG: GNAT family N-acetyltransferase [Candidatus Eremiobacteraeota bacterium]|nr:GNAT family N-acetyltransferase [Candidatus Eremiobacteraeota bacterium]MCW5868404.1 GNAT family N-acetyltransferase [Candidatus Eremiobacteraeota bacterium]
MPSSGSTTQTSYAQTLSHLQSNQRIELEPGRTYALNATLLGQSLDNVTLNGNGAHILMNAPTAGFMQLKGCSNVTVANLTVDYDPLPFTQGTGSLSLKLRPWSPDDAGLIQEACAEPYLRRMLGLRSGAGRRAAENWIRRADETSLVIEQDGEALGEVGLQPDAFAYSALLHYWVLPRVRGQGLAERAARLLCDQAAGLILTAYVSERNRASLRVLEKLGFQRGGSIRQYAGFPGPRDTYTYFRLPLKEPE